MPQHLAAIEQSTVYRHKQTVHMKNRQRMNQHITVLPAPVVFQHQRIAEQIAVAEHRPFAAPGGPAGVNDGRQVIRLGNHWRVHIAVVRRAFQQTAATLLVQRQHITRTCLECEFADPAKVGRCTHHHRRFSIGDEISDFRLLIRRVQRQKHMAAAQAGQIQHQDFY